MQAIISNSVPGATTADLRYPNSATITYPNLGCGLIFKKMSDVMKAVGSIGKDQKNQAQGFKFRGIDQFVNALYPALTANGVFMAPRCISEVHELVKVTRGSGKEGTDKHVTILMEYDFFAEDGSKVTVGPIPAEGLDSGDKATNKALSAALKYALIQTFSIPTEDMAEADLESPVISRESKVIEAPKSSVVEQMKAAQAKPAQAKAPAVAEKKTTKFAPAKKAEVSNDLDL
jgi:ERF superfamily